MLFTHYSTEEADSFGFTFLNYLTRPDGSAAASTTGRRSSASTTGRGSSATTTGCSSSSTATDRGSSAATTTDCRSSAAATTDYRGSAAATSDDRAGTAAASSGTLSLRWLSNFGCCVSRCVRRTDGFSPCDANLIAVSLKSLRHWRFVLCDGEHLCSRARLAVFRNEPSTVSSNA